MVEAVLVGFRSMIPWGRKENKEREKALKEIKRHREEIQKAAIEVDAALALFNHEDDWFVCLAQEKDLDRTVREVCNDT
ncbi:MAG TPA: hypothetical protein VMW36_09540 [Patescibacteria group bacterium]|nr:hypothetical protein [Patescibacteria group bacterium]